MAEKPDKIQKYHEAQPLVRDEDGNIIVEQDKPIIMKQMEEGFETELAKLVTKAGKLKLTQRQKKILLAKSDEEEIEIRLDGIVYIPWMNYAARLTEAFGMEWALIPKGMPKQSPGGDGIMWGFYLMIQGNLMGFSIGEQRYIRNNPEMTWGDACEGAKSNALMRLCKGIGMNLEMWKPSFVKKWKKKYAVKFQDGEKTRWKKREEEGAEPKEKPVPKKEEKKKDAEKIRSMEKEKEKPKAEAKPAKADDKGAEPEEDKEELIEKLNKKLEDATFDKKDFRFFLSKLQETKNTKGRVFVAPDDKGKPSFYAGKTGDLKALLTYFDWARIEYLKFKKREG